MKISKLFLTFSLVLGVSITNVISAQTVILEEQETNSQDSVYEQPQIQYPFELQVVDSRDGKQFKIKIEDPKLVEQRLKSIENIMPMVYNESVKKYLDYFIIKRPSFTKQMMEDKELFFPIFEKYLSQNNMPEELKYLSLLESGLNPKVVSRSKAVGLWQFMTITGKEMGLVINENVDERMHIDKSTDAACKYLKRLHNMFDDWDLALASYNTGPGRIRRTIKSTGLSNYWDLHPYIHPDTRAYVPQFIALAYLMNFGNEHGIYAENKKSFVPVEEIYIDGYLDLKTFASLSHIDLSELKKHNPHFKTDLLPETIRGYEIAFPIEKMSYFNENRIAILDSATKKSNSFLIQNNSSDEAILASGNTIEQSEDGTIIIGRRSNIVVPDLEDSEEENDSYSKYKKVSNSVKKTHKVKRGEFLNKIASKYDVTMTDIKKWNNKKSSKVLAGERLVVYVKVTKKVKTNSLAAKTSSENIKGQIHTVRQGDTLWNISQKYDGVTIEDIKRWNKMSGNTVKVGQKIKIKA